jgi:hypothetical protein
VKEEGEVKEIFSIGGFKGKEEERFCGGAGEKGRLIKVHTVFYPKEKLTEKHNSKRVEDGVAYPIEM